MADVVYNSAKKDLLDATIDMANDTIKLALVTSVYTPDKDNHTFFDDITNEVSAGGGYTSGGEALTGKSVTQDNGADAGVFDATDVTWSNATFTARAAILYKDTGTPATSPLIGYFDFGSDQSPSGVDFTVQFDSTGVATVS